MKTAVIYLDNNATTAVDPAVIERMLPYFNEKFGNAASSVHPYGWQANEAVEESRRLIASLIQAQPQEIVFTSGATEANNLAIFGAAQAYAKHGKHIITQATEHKSVFDPCQALKKRGYEITILPVDRVGRVEPQAVADAIREDTILVSIMAANNEIGTIQPLAEIGSLCHNRGVIFHTDAAQAAGHIILDVNNQNLDLVSLSAHKIYGPKGVGVLYIRRRNPRVIILPQMLGGSQEYGKRAGTLNVPGIVGFGEAIKIITRNGLKEVNYLRELTQKLCNAITEELSEVSLNGPPVNERLPGNLNLAVNGIEADALLLSMRDFAFSTGAACSSKNLEPSHVLRAIGVSPEHARGSIRLG
ncbi:MAG: cysteine desulfurase, partial [Deltaproteobacteria bacterium]|nr:cysteine desulfurase [Deltaproteobacteria bacterium]